MLKSPTKKTEGIISFKIVGQDGESINFRMDLRDPVVKALRAYCQAKNISIKVRLSS